MAWLSRSYYSPLGFGERDRGYQDKKQGFWGLGLGVIKALKAIKKTVQLCFRDNNSVQQWWKDNIGESVQMRLHP